MSDVIELRALRCSAIVGVLPEERERPQPLEFDLDLERSFHEAVRSDDVAQTTNYATILSLASTIATQGRYSLLETLAYRVAEAILDLDDEISAVTVGVRKVRPPVLEDVATVGVRCTVSRS